jgi:hypothetical protein
VHCNALQAVVGLFAHSTNTPTKVIEILAHAGLCIAPLSMNSMTHHLSDEAMKKLKQPLPRMLTMLAIDNLEIFLETEQPKLTNNGTLASLASSTQ